MGNFSEFIRNHKWKIILILLGVIFLILCFTIKFWRALIIAVIIAVCYLFGMLLDQGGPERIGQFFKGLFKKN